MQPYTFLSAVPALLGLAGFALYQVLGANKAGDEVSRRIIEKLRKGVTGEAPPDRRLTPKQVERLVGQRQRFRELVGEHDFRLLKQALTQQFMLSILIYTLALGFCAWSVYLFAQSPGIPQKATAAPSAAAVPSVQTSTGKNSPNVNSSGSGPITVTIQPQTPASGPSKPDEKKK
jgi:hypothetical protein